MIIIKKSYHKEKVYNDGTTAYNDKPTAYNDETTTYYNKPTAYNDGTTAYNDKPTTHNKYYHIRQLWRSIKLPPNHYISRDLNRCGYGCTTHLFSQNVISSTSFTICKLFKPPFSLVPLLLHVS